MSRLRLTTSYLSMVTILVIVGWLSFVSFPLMGEPQVQAVITTKVQVPPLTPLPPDAEKIISDEEKAAFNSLKTDEERAHFIEQFWARRAAMSAQRLREGITPPKVIKKVDPEYSDEARSSRVNGTVVLEITIRKDGTVGDIRVVRGVEQSLDEKAVEALRQWKFEPAKRNGEPVDISLNVEVNFNLK